MMTAPLTPVDDWGLLRFICDEEGVQTKALHFLFSFVGLRGGSTPEICHPKWNGFRRAIASSGLEYDMLRLTIAANYAHGTKTTGERATDRRTFLKSFLNRQDEAYFEDLTVEILRDKGIQDAEGISARFLVEEFLQAESIRKKGDYVFWM